MSRLYTAMKSLAEITERFGVLDAEPVAISTEVIEGNTGVVVRENNGRRLIKNMNWGFPRLTRDMRLRGDPPGRIGLVADLTNPMWEHIVVDPRYRGLIPLTHFAKRGEDHIKVKFEDGMKDDGLSPETKSAIGAAWGSVKAGHDEMRDLKHSMES